MQIWVDADACPGVIKEILYRAATRHALPLILVANQWLRVPPSPFIRVVQVAQGFDVADSHIVEQAAAFSHADRQSFANQLDRFIARRRKPV